MKGDEITRLGAALAPSSEVPDKELSVLSLDSLKYLANVKTAGHQVPGVSRPISPEEFCEYANGVFEKLRNIPILAECDTSWEKSSDFFQQKRVKPVPNTLPVADDAVSPTISQNQFFDLRQRVLRSVCKLKRKGALVQLIPHFPDGDDGLPQWLAKQLEEDQEI